MVGMIFGLMIAAELSGDIATFFSNFDPHKAKSMTILTINLGNNITSVIHAVTFFFIATYCGHRFGKLIFIKILLMLTIDSIIACGIAFYYRDPFFTSDTDIFIATVIYYILGILAAYLAYLAYRSVKKNHTKFLMGFLYSKLQEKDRVALLDLALSLPFEQVDIISPNQSPRTAYVGVSLKRTPTYSYTRYSFINSTQHSVKMLARC